MQDENDVGNFIHHELSDGSQSEFDAESDFDDDALANAEAELLAMLAPVNKDSKVPSLTLGSWFNDKEAIRVAVLRAESNVGRAVLV
jgi:hypothetical protein